MLKTLRRLFAVGRLVCQCLSTWLTLTTIYLAWQAFILCHKTLLYFCLLTSWITGRLIIDASFTKWCSVRWNWRVKESKRVVVVAFSRRRLWPYQKFLVERYRWCDRPRPLRYRSIRKNRLVTNGRWWCRGMGKRLYMLLCLMFFLI